MLRNEDEITMNFVSEKIKQFGLLVLVGFFWAMGYLSAIIQWSAV